MTSKIDVLMFVEDPGAANYVADLPAALARHGCPTRLLACGSAAEYLRERAVPFETIAPSAVAGTILAETAPTLLLVGTSENPDTLGLRLVDEAHSVGIESVGVVDAFPNAGYRFRGRGETPLAHAPDWLLLPDEWTMEAYVGLGYPAERALVCGHPHYDRVREVGARLAEMSRSDLRRSLLPDAPEHRPVIVFVAEVSTGLDPEQFQRSADYTLAGRRKGNGRTEIVLEEVLDAVSLLRPRPYFVLRLHPKNTPFEFADYSREIDLVSVSEPVLEVLYAADVVVGMTSMVLTEASLLGRHTLSVVPRDLETQWLPTVRIGITPCVTTRAELRSKLPEILGDGSHASHLGGADLGASGALEQATDFIMKYVAGRLETEVTEGTGDRQPNLNRAPRIT